MFPIFKKEIERFLSSLTGYLVIVVFLALNGLFVWILPDNNILDSGYSSMDPLFYVGPWVLLFLIPAVTMRTFSEEKKTRTLEWLFTRPVSDMSIILGKYFACLALMLFSILPTLIYFLTVCWLGSPVYNIDTASVSGSYVGMILLGAAFTSIGIFTSSLTENQIVSFILSVCICFLFYSLFEIFSGLLAGTGYDYFISNLGMAAHYASLSRGVIDSRDLLYFISVIFIFLSATRMKLRIKN
ncbi:MAG: gliding motility-associated ABC transporter permease subunit GldF [Bacteroidetes bacterium RIFCSPLOWO2_02_FULL_36_8]|nr:MAG: gliding motility-associated ABC transporter permease subunit GldF [Bacteroidetes bacterium RIFCSPLOWO2_02_FULL_36_8]OFY70767.1 MAG: gliding motility-associated ABC transporter permease subunit GldF [Bacteroidetes bacterium RIFCSPLOWO2_12_FULL_37_12]